MYVIKQATIMQCLLLSIGNYLLAFKIILIKVGFQYEYKFIFYVSSCYCFTVACKAQGSENAKLSCLHYVINNSTFNLLVCLVEEAICQRVESCMGMAVVI